MTAAPASQPLALFLSGPTASGKSAVALDLAQRFGGEIVSVDSAQVYRGLDIGSAKPDREILRRVPHHLVDILDPDQRYSAAAFRDDARSAMDDIALRGRLPILAGGTLLYFRALRQGLSDLPEADPDLRDELTARARTEGWAALHAELGRLDAATAARLDPNDAQRIQRALEVCLVSGRPMSTMLARREADLPFRICAIALVPGDRAELRRRIAERFDAMIAAGLVDELRAVRSRHRLDPDLPSMRCVGYRAAWRFIEGEIGAAELREQGIAATRQLAKRQLTWLRGEAGWTTFDCLDPDVHLKVRDHVAAAIDAAG